MRRLVGPDMIIGLSTHTPDQPARPWPPVRTISGSAPFTPTQTKKDVCAAVTLDYLDWVVANITLPFVAIGGIKRHNIADVIAHGAAVAPSFPNSSALPTFPPALPKSEAQ